MKPIILAAALAAAALPAFAAHSARPADSKTADAAEPAVDLDVKDGDVREILRSMQKQCGIRNLVIDPKVNGNGTFVFHHLPCRTAFRTVAETLSLRIDSYENDVVAVSPR